MANTKFHQFYTQSAEGVVLEKEPLMLEKADRAIAGVVGSYQEQSIDKRVQLEELTRRFVRGETGCLKSILEGRLELKAMDQEAAEAIAFKRELMAEPPAGTAES